MKLIKETQSNLSVVKDEITKGVQQVQKGSEWVGNQTAPDKDEEEERRQLDPNLHLRMREKRKWKRLSESKKKKYQKRVNERLRYRSTGPTVKGNNTLVKKEGALQVADQGIKNGSKAAASTGAGVASGGLAVVADAGVKVAKKFRESLQRTDATQNAHLRSLQEKANKKMEEGMEQKDAGGVFKYATGVALAGVVSILSSVVSFFTTLIALLVPLTLIGMIVLIIAIAIGATQLNSGGGNAIVRVAKEEQAAAQSNIGGKKYKDWFGMDADWCAIFISWCAEECGFIEKGIVPKNAAVAGYRSWYEKKNLYQTKASGYKPKPGDFVVFENGMSHIGIVLGYDSASDRIETVEGNSGMSSGSPYHKGSSVTHNYYPISYSAISGYCTPEYPTEDYIEIPEPYGTVYSYMGWQTITSPSSNQYKLRQEAGMKFDADGFGKIGDRYVIACTTTFGEVGDYIDWTLDNGEVIKSVIGDIKNQSDAGCNKWGHKDGTCVVEFVVDKYSWYGTSKHPTQFHSEWKSRVVSASKTGSFWR